MKAIIIEDEKLIGKALAGMIKNIDDRIQVEEILPSLKTARKWFAENPEPDMLFMDIQLSDGVSFDLLDRFKLNCPIVFTTAYDEYALRAFKVNSVDYLLKPVEEDDLRLALDKCYKAIKNKTVPAADITNLLKSITNPDATIAKYKQRFIVNMRNQWLPVPVKDIACFCKEVLNYIYLHNGEKYILDIEALDDVEEVLDPAQFYRANRQFIINVDAVHSVKPVENSKLIVKLKEPNHNLEIDMSRLKTPEFKKWLDR
jgi:DNA-binding LytR/AlgR family response regulator